MSNSPEERMPLLLSQQQQQQQQQQKQQQQPPSKQQGPSSKRQPKQRTTATTTPSTTTLTTTTVVQVDFPVFTDAGPSMDLSKVSNNLGTYSKKSGGGGGGIVTTTTTRLPDDAEEVVPTSSISSNNNDAAALQIPHHQLLFRHDSEFSVGSDYQAPSSTWGRKQQGPSSNLASFAKAAAAAFHQGTKTPTNTLSGGSTLSSWYDPLSQSHRVPITGGSEDHQGEPTTTTTTHHGLPLLSVWQGSLLLTADCLGTGLLALPANVRVSLGLTVGLGFLVVSAPINWYAGYLLAQSATIVERRQHAANRIFASALLQQQQQQQIQQSLESLESQSDTISSNMATMGGSTTKSLVLVTIESTYGTKTRSALFTPLTMASVGAATTTTTRAPEDDDGGGTVGAAHSRHRHRPRQHAQLHHDTATFDFIGMTQALFRNKHGTRLVMLLYYGNIFLVLGNYILVMSHAVMATVGEGVLCTPVAGLIASVLMYAVSQSRSMARLGRAASVVSLAALFVVICQCLHAARVTQLRQEEQAGAEPAIAATTTMPLWVPAESSTSIIANFNSTNATTAVASASLQPTALWPTTSSSSSGWLQDIAAAAATATTVSEPSTPSHDDSDFNDNNRSSSSDNGASMHDIFRQLSALGSIGFAMGSQKLFLNIRHELADRSTAPRVLGISLTIFTSLYIVIILLAGPNPPAFLFDAIHGYWNRRLAGLLLWMHVVVSYAINSQAICSSMDRLFWHRLFQRFGATVRKTKSSADDDEDDDDDDDDDSNNNNRGMSPETLATVRWMSLTAALGVTAYTVANAIPFFQDLVALIGAVTVVPLTLLLPALYWRKELQVPLWTVSGWWKPNSSVDWPSYGLIVFSLVFMVTATAGVFDSISQDWENHGGRPFECIK